MSVYSYLAGIPDKVAGAFGYAAAAPETRVVVMTVRDWLNVGGGLALGISIIFLLLYLTTRKNPELKGKIITPTNFWLVMSGVIHTWIEGSFVFDRTKSFIKPGLDYYASGDFRYGSPMEAGTAAMEAITAVLEGPLCWLIAYGAIRNKTWRHPAQLVLCTAQIYGLIWFVLQPIFSAERFAGHLTSDPFLFWFLVVGMNAPWGIFPVILWVSSFKAICQAFEGEGGSFSTEKEKEKEELEKEAAVAVVAAPVLATKKVGVVTPAALSNTKRKKTQ